MAKTAAELIAHLEAGGLIARGEPDHPEFLRFEIYEHSGQIQKHLGAYGWGSALGRVENRLLNVLESPFKWVCVPAGANHGEREDAARPLLAAIGEYQDYEWKLTAQEERKPNVFLARTHS